MWNRATAAETGRRAHAVIADLAGTGAGPAEAVAATRAVFRAAGATGTVAAGARQRVSGAAALYLARYDLGEGLLGTEVPLGAAVADLVWAGPGGVVVDEVKSGEVDFDDPALVDQVDRLVAGGTGCWGEAFVGVRLLPLSTPRRARLVTPAGEWWALPAELGGVP